MKVVIVDYATGQHITEIHDVSKAMETRQLKKLINKETKIDPKQQNIYFSGKLLDDNCDLCDYKIEDGKYWFLHLENFTDLSI